MNKILLGVGVVAIIVVLGVIGYFNFAKKTAPVTKTESNTAKPLDTTCIDIGKLDFKNTAIEDEQFGTLQFKNGIF